MKNSYLIILLLLFFSCKNVDRNSKVKGKMYNPKNEIKQIINDPLARKYFNKALSFDITTEYDSINFYLKLSLRHEKNPIIFNQFGINEMCNNKIENAVEFYKKGIEIDSTFYPNYINMSRCYLMLNQFSNSENILNKLIKNSDSDYWTANANMYLALVYFNGYKDCRKAKETLEKAKSLATDNDISKQYLDFENNLKNNCN